MPKDYTLIIVLIIVLVVLGMIWSNRNEGFAKCGVRNMPAKTPMKCYYPNCSWNGVMCVDKCTKLTSNEKDCKKNKDCTWKKVIFWGGTCYNKD